MSMFKWEVVYGGKTPPPGAAVAPDQRLSWGRTVGLGAQHVVAMFGATFVFPIVMGLNPNLAIMMSGIATICFLLIVQGKVPSYLGTSASFVGGASAIYAQEGGPADVTGAILVAGGVLAPAPACGREDQSRECHARGNGGGNSRHSMTPGMMEVEGRTSHAAR